MNGTPDMTWRADREGNCQWVSDGWAQFVGRSAADQSGRGWVSIIHPDDRDRYVALVQREMQAGRDFVAPFRAVRASDGRWVSVVCAGKPVLRDGAIIGYIGAVYPVRAAAAHSCGVTTFARRLPVEPKSMHDSL